MEALAKREAAVAKKTETPTMKASLSNDMLEATYSLADHLMQSEPFLQYQQADRKLHADREAMRLLEEFSELQQKIRAQQHSVGIAEGDIKRLHELQSAIGANETYQEQAYARQMAVALLQEVNDEISNLLGVDFASLTRRSGGCC